MRRRVRGRSLVLLVLPLALVGQLWSLPAAFGQVEPDPVFGLEFEIEEELLAQPWVDPIAVFELENEPLASEPEFDFTELHPSSVFEEGVESIEVAEAPDLTVQTERHLRSLQAAATAEDALRTAGDNIVTAQASIVSATTRIAGAEQEIAVLDRELAALQAENDQIAAADLAERTEQARLRAHIDLVNLEIAELAVQTFIGADEALETLFVNPGTSGAVERKVVTDEVRDSQRVDIAQTEDLINESGQRREVLASELAQVVAATDVREGQVADLTAEIAALNQQRIDQQLAIDGFEERQVVLGQTIEDAHAFSEVTAAQYQIAYHERLVEFVAGTNVPLVALNAYVRASRTLAIEDPGCGIHWSQLAGIGQIESLHGYFGDSTLDINGHTTEDIRGLPLDGRVLSSTGVSTDPLPEATNRTESTAGVQRLALIRDTDGGLLDGDPVFDRAVGPMQFIPSTWRLFDADGNGDEEIDPQNIYDASLASARLLCDSAGSMLTAQGEQQAYFAYNHDLAYSRNVTNAGRRYHDQFSVIPGDGRFDSYAASGAAEALAQANIAAARAADAAEVDDPDGDSTDGSNGDSAVGVEAEGDDAPVAPRNPEAVLSDEAPVDDSAAGADPADS